MRSWVALCSLSAFLLGAAGTARAGFSAVKTTPYPGVSHVVYTDASVPLVVHVVTVDVTSQELYLSAPQLGPVLVDRVKRGPDKGAFRVDEVRSAVIYWERSQRNQAGELVNGQLWAELDVTPQTGRRTSAPERFRSLFREVEAWLKKTCRRSNPVGFLVGPAAARACKEGLVLREAGRHGGTIRPSR